MLALLLLSCSGQGDSPWAETTVPFDMDCASCEVLHDGPIEHFGDAIIVMNPEVDDPEAQWVACLSTILECLYTDASVDDCVDASTCPDPCKREYRKATKKANDRENRLDAVESVLFEGGVCELEVTP